MWKRELDNYVTISRVATLWLFSVFIWWIMVWRYHDVNVSQWRRYFTLFYNKITLFKVILPSLQDAFDNFENCVKPCFWWFNFDKNAPKSFCRTLVERGVVLLFWCRLISKHDDILDTKFQKSQFFDLNLSSGCYSHLPTMNLVGWPAIYFLRFPVYVIQPPKNSKQFRTITFSFDNKSSKEITFYVYTRGILFSESFCIIP